MFELWVSVHRLTEVNISLKLNKNRLKGSGDRGNTEVRADRQTDGRTDGQAIGIINPPFASRWGI